MTGSLPHHPSLENLKKRAKALQKKWRAGEAEALARVRASHPRYGGASDDALRAAKPRLTDCQLALAREAGFASWAQLKLAVETSGEELANQFVSLACLCYDDPHYDHRSFQVRARQMLADSPEIGRAHIWAAAAAGNIDALQAFLRDDAALVNREGPPYGWPPLLCACYSRAQREGSGLAAVKLLLDGGADPNACTLKHNDPPGSERARRFTAFTGLVGGGSTGLANQPPHPQWRAIAELLLQRGADPAQQEQALWIHQEAALPLLLAYGLKPDAMTRSQDGPITLLGRELCVAARSGRAPQVQMLIDHGARLDERFQARTPWEHAMARGHLEIARMLQEAGSPRAELDDVQRFTALVLAADEAGARAMLQRSPDLVGRAQKEMVLRAVSAGRIEAVRLALDLGFDPDTLDEIVAMHGAAGRGDVAMVRLLLERGASPRIRETFYDPTPAGWADFFDQKATRDLILNEAAICLFDALDYDRLDRLDDVLARDPEALERPFARCLTREPRPEDWQTPLARMVERGKAEAVRALLARGADAGVRYADGRSLVGVAREKGFEQIVAMLQAAQPGAG